MENIKKIIWIFAIIGVAVFNVLVYWNQHLYYKAENTGETEKKIEILEKASKFYPLNDLIFYDLGKAYLDLGMNSLGEQGRSSIHIQKSISHFNRSLRINPTSYFGHFYLAQSLRNMSFSATSLEEDAHEQYKKAVNLAGENTEIFYEVGQVFLSRWQDLSPEDREFTVEILKKNVKNGERERLLSIFNLWEINLKDYEVMHAVLSRDPQVYRAFTEFLGEKSLSLEERQKYLAQAEFLEFRMARNVFNAGEYAHFSYQLNEAQDRFRNCLSLLGKIRFYQALVTPQNLIDMSEYNRLRKLALLNLTKSLLEQDQGLKDVESYLWEYLIREDRVAAIRELETYLKSRGLVGGPENSSFNDLDRLSFELYLFFRQGRFRDNLIKGRNLLQSLVSIPEGKEKQFVRILQIVGESFQKLDFIYDSNDFYNEALKRDQNNLEILVKLRGNYERLNAEREIQEINRRIGRIISPQEIRIERSISRGQTFQRSIILDGREMNLGLQVGESPDNREPLIAVFFNGRVVWEDYLKGKVISVSVESKVGENVLEVVPVNKGVELVKITYE